MAAVKEVGYLCRPDPLPPGPERPPVTITIDSQFDKRGCPLGEHGDEARNESHTST